jgi:hypothetical protein
MWKVAAVVVLAIAVVNLTLGMNLLPGPSEASERGTLAALMITWTMVLISAGCGLALAAFLLTARRAR